MSNQTIFTDVRVNNDHNHETHYELSKKTGNIVQIDTYLDEDSRKVVTKDDLLEAIKTSVEEHRGGPSTYETALLVQNKVFGENTINVLKETGMDPEHIQDAISTYGSEKNQQNHPKINSKQGVAREM